MMLQIVRQIAIVVSLLAASFCAPSFAAEPTHALKISPGKTISATYSFEIGVASATVDHWWVYAAPIPAFTWQADVSTHLLPQGAPAREISPRKRPILLSDVVVKKSDDRHLYVGEIVYRATLHGRLLVDRQPGEKYYAPGPLTDPELANSLAATTSIDFNDEAFRAWQDQHGLRRKHREDAIDFARRVFVHLRKTLKYEYSARMVRAATHICQAETGDCGGMSVLFVACLRSAGVPARVLPGRWAKSAEPGQKIGGVDYYQQHVKAEFFATDVGWIPVDVSGAVCHSRRPDGLDFFGWDGGDFLIVHLDTDLEIDVPKHGRKTVEELQAFQFWWWGDGKKPSPTYKLNWVVKHE